MPPIAVDPQAAAGLRRVYLFAGLDDDQFQQVLVSGRRYDVEPDRSLFEQGAPADRFFLLRRGVMKLSRLSPAGDEKIIELLHPGQTFAEALMFMAEGGIYPVTARAIEACEVLGFENRTFVALLRQSPDTCMRLLAGMSRRMHGLVEEIDRLTLQTATSRVAGFLRAHAKDGRVELQTPKHVIASRLSIKPETLSRIFARLTADGLIRVQGAQIELMHADALQRIIETGEW